MDTAYTLGLRGHFSITSALKNTARHYGIGITKDAQGAFHMHTDHTDNLNFNVDAFAPSFVKHANDSLSLEDTKALLNFMNQPFRVLAEKRQKEENPDQKHREHFDASHKDRVAIHRLLRFATTGSVQIPVNITDELKKETAECHAKTEQAMRNMDSWREEIEIGNDDNTQSTIPHSNIHPEKGFQFDLSLTGKDTKHIQGVHQAALHALFWDSIDKAKNHHHDSKPDILFLTASELEVFYNEAQSKDLHALIDKVEFEEAIQEKMVSIQNKIPHLEFSKAFQHLSPDSETKSAEALKNLMYASTALKPVLESKTMQDIWTKSHYTQRHSSPLQSICKEYAVFAALMDIYSKRTNVSPAETEAVVQEFLPLITFSDQIAETLQQGIEKQQIQSPAQDILKTARENFKTASLANVLVAPAMLKDDYQDLISSLENAVKQDCITMHHVSEAAVDTTLDFTMDVVNFIKESPKVAATFAGLATTLYMMNGGSPEDAQAATDSIMLFSESGLEEMVIDSQLLPEEARNAQNWHWDMGPLGMYKHYMYDNAVVGPAQTIMDWMRIGLQNGIEATGLPINPDPVFSKSAERTADAVGKQLFNINLFQNASHAAFWMYMVSKGYNHGFKGAHKIFDLMSPLTDLGYKMGANSAELLRLKNRTTVSDRILALTKDMNAQTQPDIIYQQSDIQKAVNDLNGFNQDLSQEYTRTLHTLVTAADARLDLEDKVLEDLNSKDIDLTIADIKQHFKISTHNLNATLKALDQFDLTLEYMADQVGIGESWYQHYVRENIHIATNALKDYQRSGNQADLQTALNKSMQQLIQTQIRHTNTSPLYAALLGHEPQEDEQQRLSGSAAAQYGKLKRKNNIQINKDKLQNTQDPLSFTGRVKARTNICGTALWGGIVGAARKTRQVAGKTIGNKAVLISTAGLAAASIGLDMGDGGNAFTDLVSSGVGGALSATVTTTVFACYNFVEDVIGVHVGSGLALLAAGAGAKYVHQRLLNPTTTAGFEGLKNATGLDIMTAWDSAKSDIKNTGQRLGRSISNINNKLGRFLLPHEIESAEDSAGKVEKPLFFKQTKPNEDNHPTSEL